jgi:uncharacterized GH25 family protein
MLLLLSAPAVFAHNFALIPDGFTPVPGSQSHMYGTFTHVVGSAQFSFGVLGAYGFNVTGLNVEVHNKNGKASDVGDSVDDFAEYVFATKTPANGQNADCSSASFSVPGGTAVLLGKFSATVGDMNIQSFTKTFLNLTNDGTANKLLGGGANPPEVIFAEDVPAGGLKKGRVVKFRFHANGEPRPNMQVHASYAGAPIHSDPLEGDMNDDYLTAMTDNDGYAAFTLNQADIWFVSMVDEENGWTTGIMFKVSEGEVSQGGSSGGCDTGVGSALLGLLSVLALAVAKKSK